MFSLQFLSKGRCLLAVSRDGRILGLCGNEEIKPNANEKTKETTFTEPTYRKIADFFNKIESNVDIWKETGADRAICIRSLGVNPAEYGRGIGRALMEASRDKARSEGYPLLYTVCSSYYSSKIAHAIGMQCVYSLPYSEYKDEDGNPVFMPPEPRTEVAVFVQKLSSETYSISRRHSCGYILVLAGSPIPSMCFESPMAAPFSKMDDGYDIVNAEEEDIERIAEFLRQHFYKHSPLNVGIGAPFNRQISDMYALRFLSEGMSLLAVSRSERRIIGACINGHLSPADQPQTEQLQPVSNEAYAKIQKFLDDMEKAVDIWEVTGADRALCIQILAVDQAASGQGIGKVLMERTRDKALSAGYPLLYVICTSTYSTKIARSIGMNSIYTIQFSEYKDEKGHPVFKPPHPHTQATMLVLKLGAETE